MPGTVYPTNDTKREDDTPKDTRRVDTRIMDDSKAIEASPTSPQARHPLTPPQRGARSQRRSSIQNAGAERHSWTPENLNVRVVLEHQYPQTSSDTRRYSYSPLSTQDPSRYPSIRRRKSRTGLKEFGAKQALQDLAQDTLTGNTTKSPLNERPNGQANGS
jgi:hypothetical protein